MTERMGLLSVNGGRARFTPRTLRAELRPAARKLAAVAVGFAGGWAVLYGALMPFGLGFVLGFAEDCFAPCAAGAALGVLLHSFGALSLRSICLLISRGALISMVVILVVLPAALMLCDWIIRHTTLKWMVPETANAKKSEKE